MPQPTAIGEVLRGHAFGNGPASDDRSLQGAVTPLWRETMFGLDWLALRTSPVYFGWGIPRGQGEPVVVVPGFMASDASLLELYGWLGRIGYRPYFSGVGRNADCPDRTSERLLQTVRGVSDETDQRVRLIGHSLGGMLARSVALDHPNLVSHVISMGSPFGEAARAHPAVLAAASLHRGRAGTIGEHVGSLCFSGRCTCTFGRNMRGTGPYRVQHFAIYSRYDGIVDWRSCMEDEPDLNDEVNCTHVGMAFHPGVYRVLARRLATPC